MKRRVLLAVSNVSFIGMLMAPMFTFAQGGPGPVELQLLIFAARGCLFLIALLSLVAIFSGIDLWMERGRKKEKTSHDLIVYGCVSFIISTIFWLILGSGLLSLGGKTTVISPQVPKGMEF